MRLLKNGDILDNNRKIWSRHCEPQAKQSRYLSEIASVATLPRNDTFVNHFFNKNQQSQVSISVIT